MKNNSMFDLVNKKVGKNNTSKAKEIAKASEWPNCCVAGCPLPTTIKSDRPTCTYHHREHGLSATCITEAIKEFKGYIDKLHQMIFWDTRQWRDNRPQLQGCQVLPITKDEIDRPTLYLKRFKKWIDKSIKERAEQIYQGL